MTMTVRLIAVSTLLAVVANADDYVWQGAPMEFSNPNLWNGASPLDGAVRFTNFGSRGDTTHANAPPEQYTVGSKITFAGNAKLILGDGSRGMTTILMGSSDDTLPVATFAPAELDSGFSAGGSALDYNCHLNWEANGGIPDEPPQFDDRVTINDDGKSYLMVASRVSTGARITGTNNVVMTGCQNSPDLGLLTVKFRPNCQASNFFKSAPDVETSCGDFHTIVLPDGRRVQYYDDGPRAGQAFEETGPGLVDISDEVKSDEVNGEFVYNIAGTILDPTASAATADDSSSSTTIIIIVVVTVLIIGIIVGVVVVMVKKQGSGGSSDRGVVSFENPMYDDVNEENQDAVDSGMYDEPTMQDGTSGYMDVPAGGEDGESFGTGYMDVAPGEGDDDDDDGDI